MYTGGEGTMDSGSSGKEVDGGAGDSSVSKQGVSVNEGWQPSPTMQVLRRIMEENSMIHAHSESESLTIAIVMYIDKLVGLGHIPALTYEQVVGD
jgi:hypothetical protein